MAFRIRGLDPALFQPLYGLTDDDLAARGVRRMTVTKQPGFPDRVALRDCDPGETVLLLNYTHQPADSPYRASHAIFVREGAAEAFDRVDVVPEVIRRRPISLRAFSAAGEMIDAALTPGEEIDGVIDRFLAVPDVAYLHAHYAVRGCFAATVTRV